MNISEVEQLIKDIEVKSKEAHRGSFTHVNNLFILNDEVENYRRLLADLEVLREFEAFVEANKEVIEKYEAMKKRVEGITRPVQYGKDQPVIGVAKPETPIIEVVIDEDKKDNTEVSEDKKEEGKEIEQKKTPVFEVPVVSNDEEKIEEKKDSKRRNKPATKPKEKVAQRKPRKKKATGEAQTEVTEVALDKVVPTPVPKIPDIVPVLPEPKKTSETVKVPVVEPGTYGLKRGEIIQDLPIYDKSEQNFQTPGMTQDQIVASQNLINSVPVADPKTIKDPIQEEIERRRAEYEASQKPQGYTPMTDAEIEAAKRNLAEPSKPMTDEEIEASKAKLAESDPSKETPSNNPSGLTDDKEDGKGKKQKVTKRKKFDWKNNALVQGFNKKMILLKGLIFGENMKGRTQEYADICVLIGQYRSTYKTRDVVTNNNELRALDTKIASSSQLTIEEKKRLYVKIAKLAKQVERRNRIEQNKAAKATHNIVEDLNEEVAFTR